MKSVTSPTRVLVAVDDPIVGIGLEAVLAEAPETVPVGRVGRLHEVRERVAATTPDVALLDVAFRRADPSLIQDVTRGGARVIVLVDHSEDECALHRLAGGAAGRRLSPEALEMLDDCCLVSLRASAVGCLPKGVPPERLLGAIRTVMGGEIAAAPWLRATMEPPAGRRKVGPRAQRPITRREIEVIGLVAQGLSNRQIGDRMGIREQTVKNHINSIMGKLGTRRRVEIGLFALRHNLHLREESAAGGETDTASRRAPG